MSNPVTLADQSAAIWRDEAAAAAEAYTQEKADEAARARDEAERAARDGVDPPPGKGDDDPIFGGGPNRPPGGGPPRPTAGPGSGGGAANPNRQPGTPEPLTPQELAKERASGSTVIDAGGGTYYVTRPFQDLHLDQKATLPPAPKLEAPGSINWLPGASTPSPTTDGGVENPPGGAPPDPPRTEGTPETTPTEPTPIKTGLGETVDKALNELLSKSPSVRERLEKFLNGGGTIIWGKAGVGKPDYTNQIIYLDPSLKGDLDKGGALTPKQIDNIASVLIHEIGHMSHPPADVSMRGLTENEFVKRRTDSFLDSEGAAAFENARALDEAGPGGTSIAGLLDDRYQQIYSDYKAGRLTEQQAIHEMGQVFGGEIHGGEKALYRDLCIEAAQMEWARAHAGR